MILCIGEILADMIGEEKNGIKVFECYPGGAPFNVCAGINNLGAKAGFIGRVGNDLIGKDLIKFAEGLGLDYLDVSKDDNHNTTLAFVSNDITGERSFCFNRCNTADYQFEAKSFECIKDANIVVLGSLMLSEEIGYKNALLISDLAKKYDKLLSFDVNYRDDIYNSPLDAKRVSLEFVNKADIVKFSEEEIKLLSGLDDIDLGVKEITNNNQLVLVTLGGNGSKFYFHGESEVVPSIKVKPVDTTGAGDAFYAGVLAQISDKDFDKLTRAELISILKKANICGALACTKKGAMSSLPTKSQIDEYLKNMA